MGADLRREIRLHHSTELGWGPQVLALMQPAQQQRDQKKAAAMPLRYAGRLGWNVSLGLLLLLGATQFKVLLSLAKQLNVEASCSTGLGELLFDSAQFSRRRIPSITISSLTQNSIDSGIIRTPKDKMSAMHIDDYYQSYRLLAAYLALLDQVTR